MNKMSVNIVIVDAIDENESCTGCIFESFNECPNQHYSKYNRVPCIGEEREDGRDVIWVLE